MNYSIDVIGVDKSWVLVIVEKDFKDLYEDIKRIWDEFPKERSYLRLMLESYRQGNYSEYSARQRMNEIISDHQK